MSRSLYSLRISGVNEKQKIDISKLFNLEPTSDRNNEWFFEIEEKEADEYFDFINYFLDILEGNYEKLKLIGIDKENISIWFLYEFDDQCNIEFLSNDLKRIGENEISLCISCWNKN